MCSPVDGTHCFLVNWGMEDRKNPVAVSIGSTLGPPLPVCLRSPVFSLWIELLSHNKTPWKWLLLTSGFQTALHLWKALWISLVSDNWGGWMNLILESLAIWPWSQSWAPASLATGSLWTLALHSSRSPLSSMQHQRFARVWRIHKESFFLNDFCHWIAQNTQT